MVKNQSFRRPRSIRFHPKSRASTDQSPVRMTPGLSRLNLSEPVN